MSKGALLLIILLLIGGYYFFFHHGSPQQKPLPSVTLHAVTNPSGTGYTVGAEGSLTLPLQTEYKVSGSVYVSRAGVKLKESKIDTTVKGPSTLPLNLTGIPLSGKDISVGTDLTITEGEREMNLSTSVPVNLPPPSSFLVIPTISVSLQSVDRTESGYDIVLNVDIYNPNDFDVSLQDVKLSVNGTDYPVSISSVPSKEHSSVQIPLTVDKNSVSGTVSGKVKWGTTVKSFTTSFSLSFPEITPPSPTYDLTYTVTSMTSSGVKLSAKVEVNNPSSLPITLKSLKVRVVKDDTIKEVSLGTNITIPPLSEKNFTATFSSIPFFVGGSVELWADAGTGEHLVLSSPLELISPSLLKPPEVNTWIEETNSSDIIHVKLRNQEDFNIDVEDFDIQALYSGSNLANFTPQSFTLKDTKELTADPGLLPTGTTTIVVSYKWGLKTYGLLFPEKISMEVNK